jgi:hypothetical protein
VALGAQRVGQFDECGDTIVQFVEHGHALFGELLGQAPESAGKDGELVGVVIGHVPTVRRRSAREMSVVVIDLAAPGVHEPRPRDVTAPICGVMSGRTRETSDRSSSSVSLHRVCTGRR